MSSYDWAFEHPILLDTLSQLEKARLAAPATLRGSSFDKLEQAAWLASLLSSSGTHRHRQRALLFAALAKQVWPNNSAIETLCYSIFSRTGNMPAAMHLTEVVNEENEYVGPHLGPLTNEFIAAYNESYSQLAGGLLLTRFQRILARGIAQNDSGVGLLPPTHAI